MRLTLAGEVSTRRFRQYAGPVVLALILFEAVSLAVTGEAQGQGEAVWGNPADSGDPPVRSESPAIRYSLSHGWHSQRHHGLSAADAAGLCRHSQPL